MRNTLFLTLMALAAVLSVAPEDANGQETAHATGPEARVQPGDQIGMKVFREPEFTDTFLVGLNGEVVLPRLGRVYVADRTAGELQENLRERLAVYLRNPTVEIVVLRRIGVHGEVRRPDLYMVDLTVTLRDVIAQAGGLTPQANPRRIYVVRDGERVPFAERDAAQVATAELRSGDQIVVGQQSWIQRNPVGAASGVVSLVIAAIPLINWIRK
jgi:protein involved in polysaccharide export with SLBB domain